MTISHVIYLEFARLIVSWQWVTEVHGQSFTFVAGHLHLWLVICICRWSVSLYIVVGSGGRVVVVVGGLVLWLLWWLMEEWKNVTHCDIRVMFKLTCEIT